METQGFYNGGPAKACRVVVIENNTARTFRLESKAYFTIGRADPSVQGGPDIRFSAASVSRDHGKIISDIDGWSYVFTRSKNPTYFNGELLTPNAMSDGTFKPQTRKLANGDVIRIDSDDLNAPSKIGAMLMFLTDEVIGEWEFFSMKGKSQVNIGRIEEENDIVLSKLYISGNHARITNNNGNYILTDLKSKAGTLCNGIPVKGSVALKEKDIIQICDYRIILCGDSLLYLNRKKRTVTKDSVYGETILKVDIQAKRVPGRTEPLIRNINFNINNGTLVAVLGQSGAGKSTLLNCLNGTDKKFEGKVTYNNYDIVKDYSQIKYSIGRVSQGNVVHENLTVYRELLDAAKLRLNTKVSRKELKKQVETVISWLNLNHIAKSRIGTDTRNPHISGGEKKRVHIGVSLVADSDLFLLDEPDAGLDPLTKKETFQILKKCARENDKTFIVIIHDVSCIGDFDQVILLEKTPDGKSGTLAFSGTPKEALEKYQVANFIDIYDKLNKEAK